MSLPVYHYYISPLAIADKGVLVLFLFLKKKLCQVIEQTNILMTSVGKVIIYVLCQFQVLHYWLYVLFFSQ